MKKNLRIMLFSSSTIAEQMALMAAKNNATPEPEKLSLDTFGEHFKGERLKYPTLCDGMTCTISGNKLLLDKTNSAGETTCLLELEEVEIFELAPQDEPEAMTGALAD